MFTVAPSRDPKTGEKQITSDGENKNLWKKKKKNIKKKNEDEDSEDDLKKKVVRMGSNDFAKINNGNKKVTDCPYGKLCFRSSSSHLSKYKHDDEHLKRIENKKKSNSKKTPCRFGISCYRKSTSHVDHFSHDSKDDEKVDLDDSDLTEEDQKDTNTDNSNNNNDNLQIDNKKRYNFFHTK